jgi:hypothetical protein
MQNPAPAGLLADLKRLDQDLAAVLKQERNRADGLSPAELLRYVREIGKAKLEMVNGFFGQSVYGVKFSEVFRRLDSIDLLLWYSYGLDLAQEQAELGHHSDAAKTFRQKIEGQLGAAQQAKEKLETEFKEAATQPPAAEPDLKPIHAVFTPAQLGQACAPPSCQTVYTEDAGGVGLSYQWAVSIPADPACAAGFQPNTPQANQATWYHADVSEGGHCNHSGTTYDPNGRGHPGTVVVVVSNSAWTCTATYFGTQGNGTPEGDGDKPQDCKAKSNP